MSVEARTVSAELAALQHVPAHVCPILLMGQVAMLLRSWSGGVFDF